MPFHKERVNLPAIINGLFQCSRNSFVNDGIDNDSARNLFIYATDSHKNGKTVVPSIAFSVFFNCNHIFVKPDLIKGTTV